MKKQTYVILPLRPLDNVHPTPLAPDCIREEIRRAQDRERANFAFGLLIFVAVLWLARCVNDLTHNLADSGRRQSLLIKGGMR
jgi:hypothetical protein